MENTILVVDDERDFLETIHRGLRISGFRRVRTEPDPVRAARAFSEGERFAAALIDVSMPGMDGLSLLSHIKENDPHIECIMVTALNDAATAVACLKKGAYDYLLKPVKREDLVSCLNRALERRRFLNILDLERKRGRPCLSRPEAFEGIVTGSDAVLRILKEAELHAASDVPVLITGESGTGKELLARAIHRAGDRSQGIFSAVNMAALNEGLFDAEFFGHAKGAFTGAEIEREGYLAHADGGTLLLDEIGLLSTSLQGKLLRVLQEGEYLRIGTNMPRRIDIRFIATTNEDLEAGMADGRFRKDLYYRLKGAWLHLPPLRERRTDLEPLIRYFLDPEDAGDDGIGPDALSALTAYDYPGNIRELRSILRTSRNLSGGGPIRLEHLPAPLRDRRRPPPPRPTRGSEPIRPLWEVEREHILGAYEKAGRNKARAARRLEIGLTTLRRKLASYGYP